MRGTFVYDTPPPLPFCQFGIRGIYVNPSIVDEGAPTKQSPLQNRGPDSFQLNPATLIWDLWIYQKQPFTHCNTIQCVSRWPWMSSHRHHETSTPSCRCGGGCVLNSHGSLMSWSEGPPKLRGCCNRSSPGGSPCQHGPSFKDVW